MKLNGRKGGKGQNGKDIKAKFAAWVATLSSDKQAEVKACKEGKNKKDGSCKWIKKAFMEANPKPERPDPRPMAPEVD